MSQATIRNSKRNPDHKIEYSKRNLGHILLRIENSKHLSNIYSYLISILIYILYYTILYTILYTIHTIYTIYFYEVNPLCIQPYILTRVLHNIHLFWDEISLLSIHPLPRFSYPHARLLLTNALSYVNMQYLPRMTFVSFPIAYSHPSCQPTPPCLLPHTPPP